MRFATFLDAINEDAATDMQVAQFAEVVHGIVYQYMKRFDGSTWGFTNVGKRGRTEPNYELAANLGDIISRMGAEDQLVNPPEWYRPEFMGKLYIVLGKTERGVDKEADTIVKGGIGHMKGSGTPVLVLYMLLEDNPNAFVDDRFNSGMKNTFIHEFAHYLDEMRTIDTWGTGAVTHSADTSEQEYFSHPKEFQAFYIEAVQQLVDMLKPRVPKWDEFVRNKYFGGGFDQFLAEFMDIFPDNYKLAPKFDKKLKRRIYKLYTELLDRQQQV